MTNNPKILNLIHELTEKIQELYGNQLDKVILYGSYARGEETKYSDIDLAIILKGDINPFEEIDRVGDIAWDISLKYSVVISTRPISEKKYYSKNTPFLATLKEEGISL